jgi:hypothetical protein
VRYAFFPRNRRNRVSAARNAFQIIEPDDSPVSRLYIPSRIRYRRILEDELSIGRNSAIAAVSILLLFFAASCTPTVSSKHATLTYSANGADSGTVPAQVSASAGASVEVAGNSGRLCLSGYSFGGWNTAADGSGAAYARGSTILLDGSVVLYARWTNTAPAAPSALHAIGISDLDSANYGYATLEWTDNADNASGVEIECGSRTRGWTSLAAIDEPVSSFVDTTISHGATRDYRVRTVNQNGASDWATVTTEYDSKWSWPIYLVAFTADGTSGSDYTQPFFESTMISLKANRFERSGYAFRGWAISAGGSVVYKDGADFGPAGSATLHAVWLLETDAAGFTYTVSNGEACITGYTGSDAEVVVPHLLGGCPVTSLFSSTDTISGAFYKRSITSVVLPATLKTIGAQSFNDCQSLVSIELPDSLTTIEYGAFADCRVLPAISLPDSVTTIEKYAFYECWELASIKVPKDVKILNEGLFCRCLKLASVTLPDSLAELGYGAFYQCFALPSIVLPPSLVSIGDNAFYQCKALTTVRIPASVSAIGDAAFYACPSLASVYADSVTPPALRGTWAFDNNKAGRRIYVPASSESAYEQATNWSEYADSIDPQS